MPHPLIGPFIFRDLGYLYQLVVPGQVPCVGAHIALQELHAVTVMLCKMAFCLSGKVVALHMDNSILNMLVDVSQQCPIIKDLIVGVSVGQASRVWDICI